jgi:hypothetical protein
MAGEELWFWRVAGASELSLLTGADQGGALVGLFGRVAVALGSVLVILSSAVSGMLPGCVLAFRAVCLCDCVCCVWCGVFLFCVSVVVCFVMFPLLLMK